MKQGAISDGAFNFIANLDLERITGGFWNGASIQANALYIYGPGLSENYVGDFSNTSNLSGPQSVRLQELWFQQLFWRDRASLRFGMLAADTEFFTSTSSALFLNGTFGAFNLIGQNFPGAPVYPLSRPGVRFYIQPTSNFFVRAAVFGMDSNLDPSGNDLHGTDFKMNGSLWMFETGYLLNQSPNDRGLQGTYKIGTFFQNGFTSWQSQANQALGIGGLSNGSTQVAVYGVADQQIYSREDRAISAFARGGFAPAQYSFVDGYLDAGFNFTGFVPNRPQDIAGIAIAYSPVSSDFSNAQILQGGSAYSKETVIEATYQIHLTPWCNIQPDVQYIITPSGQVGSPNALVVGIRSSINF
jgi:porin